MKRIGVLGLAVLAIACSVNAYAIEQCVTFDMTEWTITQRNDLLTVANELLQAEFGVGPNANSDDDAGLICADVPEGSDVPAVLSLPNMLAAWNALEAERAELDAATDEREAERAEVRRAEVFCDRDRASAHAAIEAHFDPISDQTNVADALAMIEEKLVIAFKKTFDCQWAENER